VNIYNKDGNLVYYLANDII